VETGSGAAVQPKSQPGKNWQPIGVAPVASAVLPAARWVRNACKATALMRSTVSPTVVRARFTALANNSEERPGTGTMVPWSPHASSYAQRVPWQTGHVSPSQYGQFEPCRTDLKAVPSAEAARQSFQSERLTSRTSESTALSAFKSVAAATTNAAEKPENSMIHPPMTRDV
jgi:hypothetical protein